MLSIIFIGFFALAHLVFLVLPYRFVSLFCNPAINFTFLETPCAADFEAGNFAFGGELVGRFVIDLQVVCDLLHGHYVSIHYSASLCAGHPTIQKRREKTRKLGKYLALKTPVLSCLHHL